MYLRAIRNQRSEISLYDPVGADKAGNEIMLMDILGCRGATVAERVEQAEERRILHDLLHVLDEQESYVLLRRYGLDGRERLPQREIAAELGISRSYISRIEKKAVQKLRAEFEKTNK